jgi:hypothetical protein
MQGRSAAFTCHGSRSRSFSTRLRALPDVLAEAYMNSCGHLNNVADELENLRLCVETRCMELLRILCFTHHFLHSC